MLYTSLRFSLIQLNKWLREQQKFILARRTRRINTSIGTAAYFSRRSRRNHLQQPIVLFHGSLPSSSSVYFGKHKIKTDSRDM